MDYRSVADLSGDIARWVEHLPRDFDLIVGLPRSGLLAANLLALHLNLPFTDVEGFVAGRVMATGPRCASGDAEGFLARRRKVLVVDDTVSSGAQMSAARVATETSTTRHDVSYGAVYVISAAAGRSVDYYFAILNDQPRVFEWNLMHHEALAAACVDIDGVLCRNPLPEEDDDGPEYRRFVATVQPLVRPGRRIGTIVSCRLEKYRALTERWLKESGIEYDRLVMLALPDRAARAKPGVRAAFKAGAYRESGAVLFIESSFAEAVDIARLSGLSVISMEGRQLVQPEFFRRQRALLSRAVRLAGSNPLDLLRRLGRRTKRLLAG